MLQYILVKEMDRKIPNEKKRKEKKKVLSHAKNNMRTSSLRRRLCLSHSVVLLAPPCPEEQRIPYPMTSCLNPPWHLDYDKDHPPPPPPPRGEIKAKAKSDVVAGLHVVDRKDLPSMFQILGKDGCWSVDYDKLNTAPRSPTRGEEARPKSADVVAGLHVVSRKELPTMFEIMGKDIHRTPFSIKTLSCS